jgi:hypothetical protein
LSTSLQSQVSSLATAASDLVIASQHTKELDEKDMLIEMQNESFEVQLLLGATNDLVNLLKYVEGKNQRREASSEMAATVRGYLSLASISIRNFDENLRKLHGASNGAEGVKVRDALRRAEAAMRAATHLAQ